MSPFYKRTILLLTGPVAIILTCVFFFRLFVHQYSDIQIYVQQEPSLVHSNADLHINFKPQPIPQSQLQNELPKRIIKCVNGPPLVPRIEQRGAFWALVNHVRATKYFGCDESITYTTNADVTYLDNLAPIVDRWRGPVSVAVYTPSTDYAETMKRIKFLRECVPLIKDLVTFHLFFDSRYTPDTLENTTSPSASINVPSQDSNYCLSSSYLITNQTATNRKAYRRVKGLLFPINVARNLARDLATTYYVLPSDIELYPSPDFIPQFFQMLKEEDQNRDQEVNGKGRRVFVLPVFEVDKTVLVPEIPRTKKDLLGLVNSKLSVPFSVKICAECFEIPEQDKWLNGPVSEGLHVFYKGKQQKHQGKWEPFFVGTRDDPNWDERLTWEGRGDKKTQAYSLCLLNYDFLILDNAFLVHRPGFKEKVDWVIRNPIVLQQGILIRETIVPELQVLHGKRENCTLITM